jgi:hypothetical protein
MAAGHGRLPGRRPRRDGVEKAVLGATVGRRVELVTTGGDDHRRDAEREVRPAPDADVSTEGSRALRVERAGRDGVDRPGT